MTISKDALAKGVRRITSNGRRYVVINIPVMYSTVPTLETVAKDFRMDPNEVYSSLIYHKPNIAVRAAVFIDQTGESLPNLEPAKLDEFLCAELISLAFEFGESPSGRQSVTKKEPFLKWKFPGAGLLLTLPLNDNFTKVLESSPEFLKRETRMNTAHQRFDELRKRLDILKEDTKSTATHLKQLQDLLKPFAEPCAKLDIAQRVVALMGLEPKGGLLPAETVQALTKQNKANLDELLRLANKHMLYESPVPKIVRERKAVETSANQLETDLELLVPHLKFYKENLEFAGAGLDRQISETMREAYKQLLATPLAGKITREHIAPLIDLICSIQPNLTLQGKISDPNFEKGLVEPTALPSTENAASVYVSMILTLGPQTFGNVPGPFSFSVSVAAAAQAYIESVLSTKNPAAARQLGGKLLRLAVILGSFNQQRFDQMAAAIEANDFVQIRNLNWSKSFQAGPLISSIVSIVYFAALLNNVTSDDKVTLRRCADLLQPILGAGLGVFQGMQHISRLSGSLAPYKLGMEVGVPRILAIAALVSGLLLISEEFGAGDPEGLVLAGIGTLGALLSLAGFLGFAGTMLDASVVGIPLGVLMQVAGALIGVVTTILNAIRAANTSGVFLLLQGILDELDVIDGPFQQVAISRPELQAALDKLRGDMDDSHFWFIEGRDFNRRTNPNLELLADYGFALQHIARIVDEDKLFVKARLPPSKVVDLDNPRRRSNP